MVDKHRYSMSQRGGLSAHQLQAVNVPLLPIQIGQKVSVIHPS